MIRSTPTQQVGSTPAPPQPGTQTEQPQPQASPTKKEASKKLLIILSIVGAVILLTAFTLGIFWNEIFK